MTSRILDWTEVEKPIAWVDNTHHFTRVKTTDGNIAFITNLGQEFWSGEGFNDAWVHSNQNGVARTDSEDGPLFTHITFDIEENRK